MIAACVSPTASANRSIQSRYDAPSAAVGSRWQASSSQGCMRKTDIWTSASDEPACCQDEASM